MRLRNYDYSTAGAYFVTICTQERECLFGDIVDGGMKLNEFGQIVQSIWHDLPARFPDIQLGEFIVMPNHVHGIIIIIHRNNNPVGAIHELTLRHNERRQMLLPNIIGYFKMNTAKRINQLRDLRGMPVWQRNYYDRVIRNDQEFNQTRQYIIDNAKNWEKDENFVK